MNGEIELGLDQSKYQRIESITDEAVLFVFLRCFNTVNYLAESLFILSVEGEVRVCKCLSKYIRLEQSTALPVQWFQLFRASGNVAHQFRR